MKIEIKDFTSAYDSNEIEFDRVGQIELTDLDIIGAARIDETSHTFVRLTCTREELIQLKELVDGYLNFNKGEAYINEI